MTIDTDHYEEAQKLSAEGYVDLFELHLVPSGVVRFTADSSKVWQGNTYEGTGVQLGNVARSVKEENNRPTLGLLNPGGIFTSFARDGVLNKAILYRYRLLLSHFENDLNIFLRNMWLVSRVSAANQELLQLELRNPSDGPLFILPARSFIPPEFPSVSLR